MKENIAAYGEISHHNINASINEFGMEENVAYSQVPCSMLRNEAYGVFPTTGDYEET